MSIAKTHRAQRPGARGPRDRRRTSRFRPQVQPLELRELLTATPLYWGNAASLPAGPARPVRR
jgi:hypothetical protein